MPTTMTAESQRWTHLLEKLPASKRSALLDEVERYAGAVERRVRTQLRPRTRRDGVTFMCSDSKTHLFGSGPTREAAFNDYLSILREMYESLHRDRSRLHPRVRAQFEQLRAVFEP